MTEFITKEEAEKIAIKCGLGSADDTIYVRIQNAINLAIAQKLGKPEYIWYDKNMERRISSIWPPITGEQYFGEPKLVYALKGDSK